MKRRDFDRRAGTGHTRNVALAKGERGLAIAVVRGSMVALALTPGSVPLLIPSGVHAASPRPVGSPTRSQARPSSCSKKKISPA